MSYDTVYACLERCKRATSEDRVDLRSLIEALEQLVVVLESDITQIKVALSHNAALIERRNSES